MHPLRDRAQTTWSVINGVHRRDDRKKNLSGANVTSGLFAADVLLPRLHGETISPPAFGIVGDANETAGQVTFVLVAGSEICGMRPAETEWNTKALGIADGDVSAEFPRWFYQGEREYVGGYRHQRACLVCFPNES